MGGFAFYKHLTISFFLVLIVFTISGCGDDDRPIGPTTAKDYPVYSWDAIGSNRLFRIYPMSQRLDSVMLGWVPTNGIAVSADGSQLYLACSLTVVVVGTDSLEFIAELPYRAGRPIAVSRDGASPPPPGDFGIYDIESNTTEGSESVFDRFKGAVCPPFLSAITPDSRWLVFIGGVSIAPSCILVYDVRSNTFRSFVDWSGRYIFWDITVQTIP